MDDSFFNVPNGSINDFTNFEEYLIIQALALFLFFFFLIGYCYFQHKHRYFTKIIDGKISEIQGEIPAHCSYIATSIPINYVYPEAFPDTDISWQGRTCIYANELSVTRRAQQLGNCLLGSLEWSNC